MQARIKRTMQTRRRRMDASAHMHGTSALTHTCVRRTHQAGNDFSFVMHYNSFASRSIMINKTNSQVLTKHTKDRIEINSVMWVLLIIHSYARRTPAISRDLKIIAYSLLNGNKIGIREIDIREHQLCVYA